METGYDTVDAFLDARRYGRAVVFASQLAADALQAAATEQWQLEPVPADTSLLLQGEVAPGLHLNLFTGYEPGKYELILLREEQVGQQEAGRVWAEIVASIWRLAGA